jgi:hypothetical protein
LNWEKGRSNELLLQKVISIAFTLDEEEALDAQARPDELTAIIGKNIPDLNGGIFAEHKIEKDNPNIQIPEEASEKIFTFFDAYD